MFQKKQVIYSESLGACVVDNIVPLSASRTEPAVLYYVLKCLFEDKVSYIPVEHHQVRLRKQKNLKNLKRHKRTGILWPQ